MKPFKVYVKQRISFSTVTKVNFYFILILVQNTLGCLIIFVIFLLFKVIVLKSAIQKNCEFYKINDVTQNIENIQYLRDPNDDKKLSGEPKVN